MESHCGVGTAIGIGVQLEKSLYKGVQLPLLLRRTCPFLARFPQRSKNVYGNWDDTNLLSSQLEEGIPMLFSSSLLLGPFEGAD